MNKELSVVILCYKAGEQLYDYVKEVRRLLVDLRITWEIVLVANYLKGSNDQMPKIASDIASKNENIVTVILPKQGMMGWDARSGLDKADAQYLCLIDGDGQMPAEDIVRVYNKIKREGLDFVSTYRAKRYDSFIRTANSYIYNMIFRILFPGAGLRDVNSKPKIFKKSAYKRMHLMSDDWFLDAELVIHCIKLKLKVGQVATSFYKCAYRRSLVKPGTIFEFIKNLIIARLGRVFK
ncbi:MAG: glycosyltransferase family 2 protein [Candidatus Omnitrophica bacterium]|nr:glycosyltransferase family 2 protein [Candidatus Omnitrophota bacterium]MBU1869696.1 glycosyltransferase family 2 protein [Candidatus Omnitrophota bacterium]